MYADQVISGPKRSVKDRLDSNIQFRRGRLASNEAGQYQTDERWKHDLFEGGRPQTSKLKVDVKDLRFKLNNRKVGQQKVRQGLKTSAVMDLRQKLSGTMHSQPKQKDPQKSKQVKLDESVRTIKKNIQAATVVPSVNIRNKTQKKDEADVLKLLQSLGLEKYSITFQAEEVDMAVLEHMNDDDLKALGIPMGPRKKILLAFESKLKP